MHRNEKILWSPWENLLSPQNEQYGVVILNTSIRTPFDPNYLFNLWNNAKIRITVDGGTNQWLTWLKLNNYNDKVKAQELITGDLDSVTEDALNYFIKKNNTTQVIRTPDQNETDFTKSIMELNNYCIKKNLKIDTIFAIVDTSGRFDQIIANINTLYKMNNRLPNYKIYILASDSISWLLKPGRHSITIPKNLLENQEWCSLVPIGSSCQVTTTGLKWNLNKSIMEFGGMVSTSNTYNGETTVNIQNDSFLVWSMGIKTLA